MIFLIFHIVIALCLLASYLARGEFKLIWFSGALFLGLWFWGVGSLNLWGLR